MVVITTPTNLYSAAESYVNDYALVQQLLLKHGATTLVRAPLTAEDKAEYFLLGATFTTEVIHDQERQLMLYKDRLYLLEPEY